MKEPTKFSWHQFAVNISAELAATLVERRFGPAQARPAGVSINIIEMNSDAPHDGEMHPDGDEVIYVLEGRFRVRLGSENPTELEVGSGEGVVIPRGVWHKIHILAPCRMVTVTPGPGFEYRTPHPD
jgi:mannose-6-phosphate isomerase-like protein (cupin superfamily)